VRLGRGMKIRRCKKRTNLINDTRIKICIARYDSGAYRRLQFLRAVSDCVGSHAVGATSSSSESDSDDVVQIDSDSNQAPPTAAVAAATRQQSQDLCEVCLVEELDYWCRVETNASVCHALPRSSRRGAGVLSVVPHQHGHATVFGHHS